MKNTAIRVAAAVAIGAAIGAWLGSGGQCQSGSCPLTETPLRGAVYGAVMGLLAGLSIAR